MAPPTTAASLWSRVDVGLSEPSAPDSNHYDSRLRNRDLEAEPSESVGMFVGLEVLSGSSYQVVGQRMILRQAVEEEDDDDTNRNKADKSSSKKQKTKSKKERKAKALADAEAPTSSTTEKSSEAEKPKKKKKRKRKRPESATGSPDNTDTKPSSQKKKSKEQVQPASQPEEFDSDQISALQLSWMMATGGVTLKDSICLALLRRGFEQPTPIQTATLPAAVLGRRNIVGAAPTGSGKTLAYLLPILQHLNLDPAAHDEKRLQLQALILTPTRELALQVSQECEKLAHKTTGTIVGGLATQKQSRVLEKNRPPILIGTPGRLWELLSSRQHEHLNDLSQLHFLVIDEADRMVQQGSFPQLKSILDAIHEANPLGDDEDDDDDEEESEDDDEEPDRLRSLPGVRGEAKVIMLEDIVAKMAKQRGESPPPTEPVEVDDEEFEEAIRERDDDDDDDDEIELPVRPPVQRQTFVFSATLTLPSMEEQRPNKKKGKKGKKGSPFKVQGAIANILEKAHTAGQTKIVDLTSSNKAIIARDNKIVVKAARNPSSKTASRLPPGLTLHAIECTQKHKDSHLYAYLVTTAQGASGPCLIFCNSIAAVKRVGTTLQLLRLPVRMLHANMPQKARFKAVESLSSSKSKAIVVSTDVAARGLDIPSVATIVHYDVARAVDTFIHRAGRTARGMGAGAIGSSVSLVSSAEEKAHKTIAHDLGKHLFRTVHLDGRLLSDSQERLNLASKIVSCDECESKTRNSNDWFKDAAAAAGLDVDEDMLDEGLAGGDERDRQRFLEAKRAKKRLAALLSQPMTTQRFGKFLSRNSATSLSKKCK